MIKMTATEAIAVIETKTMVEEIKAVLMDCTKATMAEVYAEQTGSQYYTSVNSSLKRELADEVAKSIIRTREARIFEALTVSEKLEQLQETPDVSYSVLCKVEELKEMAKILGVYDSYYEEYAIYYWHEIVVDALKTGKTIKAFRKLVADGASKEKLVSQLNNLPYGILSVLGKLAQVEDVTEKGAKGKIADYFLNEPKAEATSDEKKTEDKAMKNHVKAPAVATTVIETSLSRIVEAIRNAKTKKEVAYELNQCATSQDMAGVYEELLGKKYSGRIVGEYRKDVINGMSYDIHNTQEAKKFESLPVSEKLEYLKTHADVFNVIWGTEMTQSELETLCGLMGVDVSEYDGETKLRGALDRAIMAWQKENPVQEEEIPDFEIIEPTPEPARDESVIEYFDRMSATLKSQDGQRKLASMRYLYEEITSTQAKSGFEDLPEEAQRIMRGFRISYDDKGIETGLSPKFSGDMNLVEVADPVIGGRYFAEFARNELEYCLQVERVKEEDAIQRIKARGTFGAVKKADSIEAAQEILSSQDTVSLEEIAKSGADYAEKYEQLKEVSGGDEGLHREWLKAYIMELAGHKFPEPEMPAPEKAPEPATLTDICASVENYECGKLTAEELSSIIEEAPSEVLREYILKVIVKENATPEESTPNRRFLRFNRANYQRRGVRIPRKIFEVRDYQR